VTAPAAVRPTLIKINYCCDLVSYQIQHRVTDPKEESHMMSRILIWLIVSMLGLTGISMAESNDETEPRTVVRATMTASPTP
jgi:hypothetical protein